MSEKYILVRWPPIEESWAYRLFMADHIKEKAWDDFKQPAMFEITSTTASGGFDE